MEDANNLDNYHRQRFSTLLKLVAAGIMVFRNHFKPPKLLKNLIDFSKLAIPNTFFEIPQSNMNGTSKFGTGLIKVLNLARILYQRKTGQDLGNVGFDLKERIINDYTNAIHEKGLDQFWDTYGFNNFPRGESKDMITEYFNNVDDKDLVSMLSEGATLQMPIKDDISGTGYIHMRPGAMYHELDPMNVVFEVQRRNTWDQMPSLKLRRPGARPPIRIIYGQAGASAWLGPRHRKNAASKMRLQGAKMRLVVMGDNDNDIYNEEIKYRGPDEPSGPFAGAFSSNYDDQMSSSVHTSEFNDSVGDLDTSEAKFKVFYYPTPSPSRIRFRIGVAKSKYDPAVMRPVSEESELPEGMKSPERKVQGRTRRTRAPRTWKRTRRTTTTPKQSESAWSSPNIDTSFTNSQSVFYLNNSRSSTGSNSNPYPSPKSYSEPSHFDSKQLDETHMMKNSPKSESVTFTYSSKEDLGGGSTWLSNHKTIIDKKSVSENSSSTYSDISSSSTYSDSSSSTYSDSSSSTYSDSSSSTYHNNYSSTFEDGTDSVSSTPVKPITKPRRKAMRMVNRTIEVRYKPVTYIGANETIGKQFEFDNETSDIWVVEEGKRKVKFYHPKFLQDTQCVLPGMVRINEVPFSRAGTNWDQIEFGSAKKNKRNETWNLKIASWNIGGMRAWLRKNGMEFLRREKPDIFCLQETRCEVDIYTGTDSGIPYYYKYWHNGDTTYFSGVAIFTRTRPIRVYYGLGTKTIDNLGLCIAAEFDAFFVVSVHFPYRNNRYVDRTNFTLKFTKFVNALDSYKPVIILGDLKVALSSLDIAHVTPNTAQTLRGIHELDEMQWMIYSTELVDTFRYMYPTQIRFSCWPLQDRCRARNRGWRSDYAFVSKRMLDQVCDSVVRMEILGHSHCPIALFINVQPK